MTKKKSPKHKTPEKPGVKNAGTEVTAKNPANGATAAAAANTPAGGTAAPVPSTGPTSAPVVPTSVGETAVAANGTTPVAVTVAGLVKGRTEQFNVAGAGSTKIVNTQASTGLNSAKGPLNAPAGSLTGTVKKTPILVAKDPSVSPLVQLRRSQRKQHCKGCTERDNSRMVQCDTCDTWYHYTCVEVTAGVADRDWDCKYCFAVNGSLPREIPETQSPYDPLETALRPSRVATLPPLNHPQIAGQTLLALPAPQQTQFAPSTAGQMKIVASVAGQAEAIVPAGQTKITAPAAGQTKPTVPAGQAKITASAAGQTKPTVPAGQTKPIVPAGQTKPTVPAGQAKPTVPAGQTKPAIPAGQTKSTILAAGQTQSTAGAATVIPGTNILVQVMNTLKKPDTASVRSGCSKASSKRDAKRKAELQLRKLEEAKLLEEKKLAMEQQFLEQKYELLEILEEESESENDDVQSIFDKLSQVNDWIDETERVGNIDSGLEPDYSYPEHMGTEVESPQQPRETNVQVQHPRQPEIPNQHRRDTLGDSRGFRPGQRSTPNRPPLPRNVPPQNRIDTNVGEETVCILNRSQLAARHAVSKDLPEFSGKPEEWPLFYAMFNNTTQMCGFSPEENMLRLRKCLKGEALNAVSCELLHPSNVVSVLSTLRMLYGSPERIIDTLVQKIDGLPQPDVNNTDTVVKFALGVKNLCATIQACEIPQYAYDVSLRKRLVARLPTELWHRWADVVELKPMPTLLDFNEWLYPLAARLHAMGLQRVGEKKSSEPKSAPKARGKKEGFLNVHVESEKAKPAQKLNSKDRLNASKSCEVCKGSCSSVDKCKRFAEFSYNSRWATVKELKLCRKCLQCHKTNCDRKKACGVDGCEFLHHPLLHSSKKAEQKTASTNVETTPKPTHETASSCNVHQERTSDVLFRFVPVVLYGPSKQVHTYAFIDDGSELTLLEQSLADELGVQGKVSPLCLKWTGDGRRLENLSQKVNLEIAGTSTNAKKHQLTNVRTVEKLQLRPQTMIIDELQKSYHHLKGLPIDSYMKESPRILIGVDHAKLGHVTNSREGKSSEPIGVKTCLGWCVYGRISATSSNDNAVNSHQLDICPCNYDADGCLHKAMKEYFSLDSTGVMKPGKQLLSTDDERALQLLDEITHKKGDRYESGLLWKYDSVRLPASEAMARKRWECLRRRMQNDPVLNDALNAKIDDYIAKGYIRKLSKAELKVKHPRVWYLPVFPVVNPNKPAKIRIVWDAAAKVYEISLNSLLHKGPDLLTLLLIVLIQFREFKIAVCGDLREMFHQILMREEDQHCQRFFWSRKDNPDEPEVYVMQVMTFGACCSPSTAQYVKNKHARQYERDSPEAVRAITQQHYVDDMLVSVETEEEAANLACEVKRIHAEGGFEMRNWLSNSDVVLARLTETPTAEKDLNVGESIATEKILGMWWNTKTDCFTYKLSARCEAELLSGRRRPTKREVLRTLMLMFDPVGLIAHFLMFLKVLLQEIWRSGINWNDEIGDKEFEKWLLWVKVLPKVENVEVPRCYRMNTTVNSEVQLHVFTDASENGFAAVAYLRFKDAGYIEVALVGAKTRVAPLRFLSIPRSELQAAVLGVRLGKMITQSLSLKVSQRFFHTDSRDVLCWINSDHRRYTQFVGVRICEMLEDSEASEWHWISTKHNVADEGTKWKGVADLNSTGRWFRGPEFLWKAEEDWPAASRSYGSTDEELRPHLMAHIAAPEPLILVDNFSNWRVLVRRTAFVQRCALNWRRRVKKESILVGPLSQQEFVAAENYLYRIAQGDVFADVVAILAKNRSSETQKLIPKSSSVYHVCPFLDVKDVLRVLGRTGACTYIDAEATNPVILPREHHITRLIVAHYHQRFHHQNHNTVVNELRQRYYIPRLKATYQAVRKACQRCKNDRAVPCPPLMGDLVAGQLSAFSRPFTHMGVDYFGPISVSIGRRSEKRWGVLATCLTSRAIHLQMAHSLSTDSCIMALRNIFARRGTPAVIYSDRGTNFQGASNEFKAAVRNIDQDRMVAEFTSAHTEWRFNPPAAPHMGGMWERLIGTVKQNLNKILESRVISAEVLDNALTEVENIVNSRPLTDIPIENDQSPVLTPNHFLLLGSNGLKPLVPFDDSSQAIGNNYKTSQTLANAFWELWVKAYLNTITRRTKWFIGTKSIEVDDVVLIVDPKLPRNCWPKGRVIATQPGSKGQVRAVTVQAANRSIYERPAVNIAVLDVGVHGNTPRAEPQRIPGGSVGDARRTPCSPVKSIN